MMITVMPMISIRQQFHLQINKQQLLQLPQMFHPDKLQTVKVIILKIL
jgi:hypothetical protein